MYGGLIKMKSYYLRHTWHCHPDMFYFVPAISKGNHSMSQTKVILCITFVLFKTKFYRVYYYEVMLVIILEA